MDTLLPIVLVNIIYDYKKQLDYNDCIEEYKKELNNPYTNIKPLLFRKEMIELDFLYDDEVDDPREIYLKNKYKKEMYNCIPIPKILNKNIKNNMEEYIERLMKRTGNNKKTLRKSLKRICKEYKKKIPCVKRKLIKILEISYKYHKINNIYTINFVKKLIKEEKTLKYYGIKYN